MDPREAVDTPTPLPESSDANYVPWNRGEGCTGQAGDFGNNSTVSFAQGPPVADADLGGATGPTGSASDEWLLFGMSNEALSLAGNPSRSPSPPNKVRRWNDTAEEDSLQILPP